MIAPKEVEREILEEESVLEQIALRLESRRDLAEWTEAMRTALALALEDGSMSRTERWKAVVLRRHLFGPAGAVPDQIAIPGQPSDVDRKRAERLRAGLPARVRYRAGMYLLHPSP
jgi:hypothetical protein